MNIIFYKIQSILNEYDYQSLIINLIQCLVDKYEPHCLR